MFLAIKEIRYSKLRYGLIVGIMFLTAYVVFMLSGLANGLSGEFKKAIDDWNTQEVVLLEDANQVFAASQLTGGNLRYIERGEKAPIGLYSGTIKGKNKENVTVSGTTKEALLLPELTKGHEFKTKNEIVVSQNLADSGYKVGGTIKIGSYDDPLTIVGIFPETYHIVSPVICAFLDTWTALKYEKQPFASEEEQPTNGIVIKDSAKISREKASKDLQLLTIGTFTESIPGHSTQNMTLDAVTYFLFLVAVAVVGIFMHVMTLQKTVIFGVMKAQGIKNFFIAKSLVAQSFIAGVVGILLAPLFAYLANLILPNVMPFAVFWSQWLLYSGILIIVVMLGGLFSIRTITKVDPVTAIGS